MKPLLILLACLSLPWSRLDAQDAVIRVIAMPSATRDPSDSNQYGLKIDEYVWSEWRRLRAEALAAEPKVLVFEITTPGGSVSVTQQIVNDLLEIAASGVRTVAYVPGKATSAGAILTFACQELVMGPGALIGNAIPIQFDGLDGYRLAEEKVATEVLSLVSDLARRNGYPEKILRAMVDPHMELWRVRFDGQTEFLTGEEYTHQFPDPRSVTGLSASIEVTDGEALKMDRGFALRAGFVVKSADERNDLPRVLGIGDRPLEDGEVLTMKLPPMTRFWGTVLDHGALSLLVLIAAVVFLVLAFQTPGLGLYEALSLVCFVGYFMSRGGDSNWLAFTTGALVLGFLLILVELFFIPGFGVAGISGIVLILLAVYGAGVGLPGDTITERLVPNSPDDWTRVQAWLLSFFFSVVAGGFGALLLAPKLRHVPFIGRTFIGTPKRPAPGDLGSSLAATTKASLTVGLIGETESPLRPSGRARFQGSSAQVKSEGMFIEPGQSVMIVKIEGNRITVRATETPSR